MKFTKFYSKFNSFMASLITEATLEKMSKADQEAVNSGDPGKIKARIEFWKKTLTDEELQKNGKRYKNKTAKMYMNFLEGKLKELEEKEEKKKEEKKKEESQPEQKPLEIEVSLDVKEEE